MKRTKKEKKALRLEKKNRITIKRCQKTRREDGLKMRCVMKYTFRDFVDAIVSRYPERLCYAVYRHEDTTSLSYRSFANQIHAVSQYLLDKGVKKGDKIAIFGESCPTWMVFYLGLTSIGGIAVPILPGFTGLEAEKAMRHSECIGICAQSRQYAMVNKFVENEQLMLFRMEDLFEIPLEVRNEGFSPSDFLKAAGRDASRIKFDLKKLHAIPLEEQDIASIIYTSGTTGTSKGVVLTHMNILRMADRCTFEYVHIRPGARCLSILPMSHVYEFTIGHILVLLCGCSIYFLGKPPAVSILMPALQDIRPNIMESVPLLMEKVYKAAILPVIKDNPKVAKLIKNPLTRGFVYRTIGHKLRLTFGGKMKFFGIGGAPLDIEVEKFLYKANFPYAKGYGLTETSPLLAGCGPKRRQHLPGVVGPVMPDVTMKLLSIDSDGVGEVAVKGPSVMSGYYKNDELNAEAFTGDGYFRTGDLGQFDKKGRLAIKGRCKTMILGPAGENIYPESIESLINNQEFVQESLVVLGESGGLVALIKLDIDLFAKKMKLNLEDAKIEAKKYLASMRGDVNKQLGVYNRIDDVKLQEEEFERTATQKIKRFLYPKKNADNNQDEDKK